MSTVEIVELVGGLLAVALGGVEWARTRYQSTSALATVVLGATFVLLAFV